jgi:uncharacterized protein YkwD
MRGGRDMKILSFLVLASFSLAGCAPSTSSKAVEPTSQIGSMEVDPALDIYSAGIANAEARKAFDLVNQQRISNGLEPLKFDPVCQNEAAEHNDDMINSGFFDHNSPTENFRQRMTRWDLLRFEAGENLAETDSPEHAVTGWMNSPAHRRNILLPHFHSGGMAYRDRYYTQCFSGKSI